MVARKGTWVFYRKWKTHKRISRKSNWTFQTEMSHKSSEISIETIFSDVISSGEMSSEYKDKQGGGAGQPLSKSENNEGKKTLTNGMSRVHRILTDDEMANGRTTRWTELEIHGLWASKNFQNYVRLFQVEWKTCRLPSGVWIIYQRCSWTITNWHGCRQRSRR